jgi:predicted CopG family antitoxin
MKHTTIGVKSDTAEYLKSQRRPEESMDDLLKRLLGLKEPKAPEEAPEAQEEAPLLLERHPVDLLEEELEKADREFMGGVSDAEKDVQSKGPG